VRDLLVASLILLLLAAEGGLWVLNPMHIPGQFITARAFGLQLFDEPGDSMAPTVAAGRRVLVSSWTYLARPPRGGDVVAFCYPPDPSIADLKRIVATAGSTIEIRSGLVYVDDKLLGPPNAAAVSDTVRFRHDMPRQRVPPDSFFVLGDNLATSEDSRTYGFISRASIIGKSLL